MKVHAWIFTLLFFLMGSRLAAQSVSNYTFQSSAGTFTALTGANTQALTAGNTDDGNFDGLPIGFDFWYLGTRYTTVSASTNGWLTFGAPITNPTYANSLTNSGAPRPVVAPLWDDLEIPAATSLSYLTSGTAGSRVFTLQWLNAKWTYVATAAGISFQAKIYESTGKIEFVYRQEAGGLASASASIGITATATGNGNFRSLNSSGNNPGVSSTSETTTIASKPSNGRTYAFTPPVPTAPTNLAFSSVGASSMTLAWTDNSNNELGFVLYRSTDGVNYTFDNQTAANVTGFVATGLSVSTTYYWKVFAVTEGGLSTALSGSQATICTPPNISQIPTSNLIGNYRFRNNATDETGTNPGTLQGAPTAAADRFAIANRSYSFNGTSQYVSTTNSYVNPVDFTLSIWFKTSTTTGGKLIGFGNNATGSSANYDRHIYMNNAGQIYFGVYPGAVRTINSPAAYNDNAWHLATAMLSSTTGMALYIDGAQVAADPSVISAEVFTGYWRIGYDNVNSWTSQPSSFYFSGSLDDVLIYQRALSPSEVLTLYKNPDGAGNNGPVCIGSTLNLTAPTVASTTYAWTGPNGFNSASQNPSLTFAAANAGVYALTATLAGCPATAYTTVVASSSNGEWTGNTSSDWATASNWCTGTLPTTATDVTIPAGATNMPVVGSSVSCKNLTIQSGATVTTSVSGTLNIAGTLTNNGTMVNNGTTNFNGTSGQQTFSGVTAFHNISVNNANGLLLPSAITVANDLTIGAGILTTNNHSITVAGSWYNNASTAGFAAGTSTVTFNGSAAQTLGGSFATTFNHLTVTNTGNTVTSAANCTVGGNLMVTSGTLNLGAFTANRGSVGGTLTVNNNATLKIGGTNTFPTNYTTNTLLLASNVEYAGTNQTIANHAYGNLILSSESGAAVKTFPGTALSVMGNLTLNQGAGTSVTATAAANIAVNGNVSIGSATTLNGGGQALAIGGNWVNNGTFTGNGSTVSMNGTGKAISGSGTHNFHNLTVTAPSVTMAAATNIQVAGNLATTGIGALTHGAGGTLTMSGSSKTISGLDIMLDNLTVSGTASAAMSLKVAGNLAVSGSFTTSAGVLELSGASKTITGAGSISLHTLKTSGSISSTANFSITNSLNVTGSLSASAGTVTFTGTSSLTGIANLYNVDLNCTTATLDVNAVMGIANALTVTAGTLDVATHEPNTVNFNGSGAQSVNAITYNKLVLSGGNTKTAAGPVVAMDLLIAAATTFSGATHTHELRRNWTNNGTFTAGTSTVEFTGTEESILTGPTTFHILTLDKASSAGTAKLASNISVPTLNMVTGTLFTYANTITITTTRTGNGVILGNIQRQHSFTTGVDYAFESPYNTVNFSAVTGVTSITVSVATGTISDFPFGGSISRVYDIDVPAGSYTATLRLHYRDAELNGNVESTMALWHYNGATWGASGSTGNSTTNNYVEQASLTDITDRWTLSDNANVIQWNGSVSSDWNTAANWTAVQGSPSAPPGLSDIAKLGTAAFTNQPTISTAVTVKNILFGSVQAVTLSLGSGGSLNTGDINGQWTSNVAHTLAVGAQTLTVNGDLNLSDGTNGHTIDLTIGAGTVTVNQLLEESGDADITFSGAGTLNVGGHFHYMGGTFTAGSGTVVYNGSTMQHVGIVTYNNLTIDNSAAAVEIGDTLVVNGDLLVSTGNLGNNALLTIGDDVTIASGATFENWEKILVAGDWTNNGTFSDFGGTTIFNGTGAQSISTSEFGNLIIDKSGGTATITGDLAMSGDFSLLAGTFDFQGYFINRNVLGGFASISNGATALISGTNGPVNFSTYALGLTSTIVFNGTGVQYVNFGGLDFGNVILRNGGANPKVLVSEATVLGNLTIESGATLNADSWPITLDGNWVNNGSFVPGTSTLHLTGTGKTLSGVTTFNKGTVTGSYFANQDLTFNDILEITPGGSISAGTGHTLILHGDLLNAGTMSTDGTVILSGTQAQTLSLVNATNYALYVEFNGSVPPTLNSTSAPVFGYLAVNNTGGVSPSVGWTVGYGMTVGSGATFNGGAFTHSILGNFTNSGTVTSSGILNFAPGAAATVNLGSNFASTGLVKFAGAGAMALSGSPTALYDVTVANTHASGISPATDWTLSHDLTIQSGATLHGGARTFTIGRNFTNSGTFDAGSSTLVFNGTALQTFTSSSAVHNMTVSKASDLLALASDASVGGTLNFTAGKIQTSTNSVNILASGSLTGAAQNTGWVYGNLQKNVGTGSPTRVFEVGDASVYAPASLAFASVSTAGDMTVAVTPTDHPNVSASNINPTKSLNRHWTVSNSGTAFTGYALSLNFVPIDVDGGATATAFEVGHFNGSTWLYPTVTSATGSQIVASGITTDGEFAAGEICNKGTAIDYPASPYCGNAGTAAVTLTGTTGGSFASTAGLSLNASTGEINLGSSLAGTYSVSYTVAAAGGCPVYVTAHTVTVTDPPTATVAYPLSPYCEDAGIAYPQFTGTEGGSFTSTAGLSLNASNGNLNLGISTAGTYTVTYTIPAAGGCAIVTTTANVTVSAMPNLVPYADLLAEYKFEETALDATGHNDGTLQGSPTLVDDRFAVPDRAYSFNGTSQYVSTANAYSNPSNFTISVWFKTTSSSGGHLIGFGSSQTGSSVDTDRHLYMNNAGKILFGVYPGAIRTIVSPSSYNDGNWHIATATLSPTAGMVLYMDGAQVATDPTTTAGLNYTGYWRIGYDNLGGWTSQPSSNFFAGTLDDATIYDRALTAVEASILHTTLEGAGSNSPVCTGATLNLTASTMSGATYSWTGPNSFTSSSQNPSFAFAPADAGVYTVQIAVDGCIATVFTQTSGTSTPGLWTGAVSTDWATAGNWCDGNLPTSAVDVLIPNDAPNMPSIGSSVTCKDLTIQTGSTVTTTVSGTLNIAGDIANGGTMVNNGTTRFDGTTGQQTFAGVTNFHHMVLDNADGLLQPANIVASGDITITTGTWTTANFNITLAGDWTNDGAFAAGTGTVTFNASATQSIDQTGTGSFYGLTVDKTSNNVSLSTGITVSHTLSLTAGPVDLNTHVLTIGRSDTTAIVRTDGYILSEQTDNSSRIDWMIGNAPGRHEFPFGAVSGNYIPVRVLVTAGNIDTVKVSTYPTNNANLPFPVTPTLVTNLLDDQGQDNSPNAVNRFWEINTTGPTGVATLTFTAQISELDAATNLLAQRWDSLTQTWDAPLPGQSRSANVVTVPNVSEFTSWTLTGENAPLSVEFLTFEAYPRGATVVVKWTTATETNSDYFAVQRSRDGVTFETAAIVQAAGNSNALLHYSMVDQLPFQGRSFYRVVETDQDGNTTATNVAEVNFGDVLEMVFVASPNPTTQDNIGMTITGAAGEMIRLSLTDVHGHEIRSETVEITSDTFRHVFQGLPALTQGIYILHAHGNHAEGSAKILVK